VPSGRSPRACALIGDRQIFETGSRVEQKDVIDLGSYRQGKPVAAYAKPEEPVPMQHPVIPVESLTDELRLNYPAGATRSQHAALLSRSLSKLLSAPPEVAEEIREACSLYSLGAVIEESGEYENMALFDRLHLSAYRLIGAGQDRLVPYMAACAIAESDKIGCLPLAYQVAHCAVHFCDQNDEGVVPMTVRLQNMRRRGYAPELVAALEKTEQGRLTHRKVV
jgi:hypothetical protein